VECTELVGISCICSPDISNRTNRRAMMKSAKTLVYMLLGSCVLGGALSAQTNPDAKFTLVLKASDPVVTLGSSVTLEINITNISEEALTLAFGGHGGMPDGYRWEVQDDQGTPVSRFKERTVQLPNGQTWHISGHASGSSLMGRLDPGKSILQFATLNSAFKFDHPGRYTIRTWRPLKPGTGATEIPESERVYSNTITITLLPAKDPTPR
jgi:hypothetical protein